MATASDWARNYLRAHLEVVTVRLGHGYDPDARASYPWVDTITADDRHREVTPPGDVGTGILDTIAVGHWTDVGRDAP